MNVFYREYVNGSLLILNISILMIITHQLNAARSAFGKGWSKEPGVASACAMWWIFLAEAIRSWLAWSTLHSQSLGIVSDEYWRASRASLWIIAGIIAAIGTARLIYTLSPPNWGHNAWITSMTAMGGFIFLIWIGAIDLLDQALGFIF